MMRKISDYNRVIKLLQELHSDYPDYTIAQHLATALSDYGDFWGLTDKEVLFALEKYKSELALDIQQLAPDTYVQKIVEDANNLFGEVDEEEDEYGS
jgi:hypothetical protein